MRTKALLEISPNNVSVTLIPICVCVCVYVCIWAHFHSKA